MGTGRMAQSLTPENSERITILRFLLIVLVVFIHIVPAETSNAGIFISDLFSNTFARSAVPLFFCISGYLFFNNFSCSLNTFIKKWKNRFKTLVIPYIFWNSALLCAIVVAGKMPMLGHYFDGGKYSINPTSVFTLIDYYIGYNNPSGQPIMYQFWFIRELIIISLLTPLLYWLIKKLGVYFILIVGTLWYSGIDIHPIFKMQSVLFFTIGAYLALKKSNLNYFDVKMPVIGFLFCSVTLLDAVVMEYTLWSQWSSYLHRGEILLGILFFWVFSRAIVESRCGIFIKQLSVYTFFLYAFHEPVMTLLTKVIYSIVPYQQSAIDIILYFGIPLVTITISVLTGTIIKRYFPGFFSIITGSSLKQA
jgi:surface polysaccharide O-acyltransferase-like enzyme